MNQELSAPASADWATSGALPTTGGTLSGAIDMQNNTMSNVKSLGFATQSTPFSPPSPYTVTVSATVPPSNVQYTVKTFAGGGSFVLASTTGGNHVPASYETVSTVSGAVVTLTAAQLATGIVNITDGSGGITLPTGAQIAANSALATFNSSGMVFKVLITVSAAPAGAFLQLSGATGCNIVGGSSVVTGISRILYFYAVGNSVWNVY